MNKDNKIDVLKKSNILISSKYNSSILENKLLTLGLLRACEEDGRIVSRLTTSELKKYLCGDKKVNGSFYSQIKSAADEMMDRKIFIENKENNNFIIMGLIGVVKYQGNVLEIKFEPDMTDYILNVKSNYTNLNIPILMSFKKNYSYRLYEILKSGLYERNRNWYNEETEEFQMDFDLAELKLSIGVVDTTEKEVKHELRRGKLDLETIVSDISKNKKFESWSNFKFCVIDPAVSEINEKSDILVKYKLIRSGNGGRVAAISFLISKKEAVNGVMECEEHVVEDTELIDSVLRYIDEPISRKDAALFLKHSNNNIELIKDAYDIANKQESIDNFVGWMISAISGQYHQRNIVKKSYC